VLNLEGTNVGKAPRGSGGRAQIPSFEASTDTTKPPWEVLSFLNEALLNNRDQLASYIHNNLKKQL